ncbi:hypothetical protein [Brunnivagina elsteri]|uniref:Uncharacterized protein n=1 Tax=Brunnivagina elsteri CCALA 953 TaxID=987040 RepID=A0A2A2TPL9_9CYAN|nr:hypothetical protein [Calothrix elsteri]PAX60382.1 hypothetical protein CK510_02110 [Calothrix elsteri CCALA 953]
MKTDGKLVRNIGNTKLRISRSYLCEFTLRILLQVMTLPLRLNLGESHNGFIRQGFWTPEQSSMSI